MLTTILAYVLLAFFAMEGFMRQGKEAKNLRGGGSDRGSTILIGTAFGIAIAVAPILSYLNIGHVANDSLVGWIGILIMLLGTACRLWSMKTLGEFYTRSLRVIEDQRVVEDGPYRLIRHPGYLGTILIWVGSGLAMVNWITTATVAFLMIIAHIYRIQSEEVMLVAAFGESYRAYMTRTWRLVPFVY
jgi:protein-S-isoprenylcysteine O-methyltransferase Ste14